MPTFVLVDKCKGCMECVRLCPSDIMHIDPKLGKAYNVEPSMCWECFCCVKGCPESAVDVRGYADFAPLGHRVSQQRTADHIQWRIESRGGAVREYAFPIRTTPWDSISSPASAPAPSEEMMGSQLLSFEPDYLAIEALPTLSSTRSSSPA
jgi:adenylylsulfate reductase, subunit B